jgi:hypothetical protein
MKLTETASRRVLMLRLVWLAGVNCVGYGIAAWHDQTTTTNFEATSPTRRHLSSGFGQSLGPSGG